MKRQDKKKFHQNSANNPALASKKKERKRNSSKAEPAFRTRTRADNARLIHEPPTFTHVQPIVFIPYEAKDRFVSLGAAQNNAHCGNSSTRVHVHSRGIKRTSSLPLLILRVEFGFFVSCSFREQAERSRWRTSSPIFFLLTGI